MVKIVPIRAVNAIRSNELPVQHATKALLETVQPVSKISKPIDNKALGRLFSLMSVVNSCIMPVIKKQSKLVRVKKNFPEKGIELYQNIGSSLKGFADTTTKQPKSLPERFKNISDKTREIVSDFKEFCKKFSEVKSAKKVSKGSNPETVAKSYGENETTNIFDRILGKRKYTKKSHSERPHSESNKGVKNKHEKPEAPKYETAKPEAPKCETAKPEAPKYETAKTDTRKGVTDTNVSSKKGGSKKPEINNKKADEVKPEQPQKYSNPIKVEKETKQSGNPFGNFKQPELPKAGENGVNVVNCKFVEPTKSKEPVKPKKVNTKQSTTNKPTVKSLKSDINILEIKIFVGKALGQDTEALRKELETKKSALTKLKCTNKVYKRENKVKTKHRQKFRRLSRKNYEGKPFGAITGKGGLTVKEQYNPDGKLLRTLYNKGNGLIEIKDAVSNKTYFMRDGMMMEKSVIEQQNDCMQRLLSVLGSACGSTETQCIVRSYAEKCGMKKVNQTIILDGKTTKIIYKGFGYDITADGTVLAKNYTKSGQVFYKDLTRDVKRAKNCA